MIRQMNLQQKYYDFISEGKKTFEGRLGSDKNRQLSIGDTIVFNDTLKVIITSIHIFRTYEDAMKVMDFRKLIPDAKTPEDAVKVYEEFYPREEQIEKNVYVFGIRII